VNILREVDAEENEFIELDPDAAMLIIREFQKFLRLEWMLGSNEFCFELDVGATNWLRKPHSSRVALIRAPVLPERNSVRTTLSSGPEVKFASTSDTARRY
jgi:hypothetical protein